MTPAALLGGFRDAPTASARAFRAALEAMARPGTIWTVEGAAPPAPLSVAAGVLILTLCDGTTPVHLGASLDLPDLRDWVTFHTGAPLVGAADARFAVGTWDDLMPVSRFAVGLPDYPDRSATLIVELSVLAAAHPDLTATRLSGPGIADSAHLALPETAAFRANRALIPMGFDSYLTCGNQLAGLPRSTFVEAV
jgi:alpha-D-ribose 1-methylphosphonate 5-triphosphate synthase subunit PhnH